MLEDLHRFNRDFLQRDAFMRALWSDRQNCSHNVSQNVKCIRGLSEDRKHFFEMLVFQDLEGLTEVFSPDVSRDIQPKTSSLG